MNSAGPRSVDVVVVGTGLAGLTAADQLAREGYDTAVIEGRDRVGGRVRGAEIAGVPVDAGATWVAPGHTAVRDLASRLGYEFTPSSTRARGSSPSAAGAGSRASSPWPPGRCSTSRGS